MREMHIEKLNATQLQCHSVGEIKGAVTLKSMGIWFKENQRRGLEEVTRRESQPKGNQGSGLVEVRGSIFSQSLYKT